MTKGIVVGIDKQNGKAAYRVIGCQFNENGTNKGMYNWNFKCEIMPEEAVINTIKSSKDTFFINASIDASGKVTGRTASLTRFDFEKTGHHPLVIISQMQTKEGRLLGYKVGTYDGNVKNISLKEMIAYGNRVSKQGKIPVQNAIFIPEDIKSDKRAHFKSYPNMPFITELYDTGKNVHSEANRRVAVKENEKTLVKASEIFDREQLEQLKLGKQAGLDIRVYANPRLSANKMKILREGMMKGHNVRPFAFPEYSAICMMYYVDFLDNKLPIKDILNPKYTEGHLFQLALAVELGLDLTKLSNPNLSADDMSEMVQRMEKNIWRDELVKKDGSWK